MTAPTPAVWTAAQFKQETNPKNVRKALREIDELLGSWDTYHGGPPAKRIDILRALARACVAYLQVKQSKKAKKEQALIGKPSPRLVNRLAKVRQLAQQVFVRLAFERFHYQKMTRSQVHGGPAKYQTQLAGLKGSYAHERSNFEAIKQGLGPAETQTPINPQGASFVHQRMAEAQAGVEPEAIAALLARPFDSLTLAEFNQLSTHFAGGVHIGAEPLVHFARKDERLRELMLVPNDGLLYTTEGTRCDVGWSAYAIDKYGNLFIARANRTWKQGEQNAMFNHSTLCAGREVICAGEIRIKQGLIEYISNESGHYKPTAAQLANAINTLIEEYSLPLSQSVQDVVELTAQGNKVTHKSVRAFIAAHPGGDN
jgi:hypothetical protein